MQKLADISAFESLCVHNGIGMTFKAKDYERFTPYSFPSKYTHTYKSVYPDYKRDDNWYDVYDSVNGLWIDDDHSHRSLEGLKDQMNHARTKRERQKAEREYWKRVDEKNRHANQYVIMDDFDVPVPLDIVAKHHTPDEVDYRETAGLDKAKEIISRFGKRDVFDYASLSDDDRRALMLYFCGSGGDDFWGADVIRDWLKETYPEKRHDREGLSFTTYDDDVPRFEKVVDKLGKQRTPWTLDDLVKRVMKDRSEASFRDFGSSDLYDLDPPPRVSRHAFEVDGD